MKFNEMSDDWKKEAPKLASLDRSNPFIVPENYFNELSGQLQSRINIEKYLKNRNNGFTVPEGYFETLPDEIESRIFAEKLKQSVSDTGFTVPDGYFSNLSSQINQQLAAETNNQVISIRRKVPSWINYAAAACVTIAIGSGIFINYENSKIENQLSTISEAEIVNYLQLHTDNADTEVIYQNLDQNFTLAPVQEFSNGELQEYQEYLNSTIQ